MQNLYYSLLMHQLTNVPIINLCAIVNLTYNYEISHSTWHSFEVVDALKL